MKTACFGAGTFLLAGMLVCMPTGARTQVCFPLHVGDIWGYTDYTYICEGTSIVSAILSDTLINGERYAHFEWPSIFSGPFVRADTRRVFEYDTTDQAEALLFDFSASAGDTIAMRGTTITIALGSLRFAVYDTSVTGAPRIYTIQDSIGVVSQEQAPCLLELVSAFIDGRQVYPETGVEQPEASLPAALALEQNYPNPFNAGTVIRFYLPVEEFVSVAVCNSAGQRIASLHEGRLAPGWHLLNWEPSNLPSGLYFYTLATAARQVTRSALLVK